MVLELPELARENQDWKIYHAHILDSAATEGVVSHLSGAAPKPVDSCELEAWNASNAVAKYIILEVITDSLLERLVHHKLAHTLFSHLAAIFGDHEPIAIEPPTERSHQVEPLHEDSHPKSDGAYSARTAEIIEGIHVEGAGAATEIPDTPPYAPDGLSSTDRNQEKEQCGWEHNAHDTNHNEDLTSLPFEPKTNKFHDRTPSGTTPAGIPIIPSIPNTNSTTIYPKDLGDPLNAPDGTSRGDDHETAENGGQWQRTTHEVTRNDAMASPAPNLADRTSEMTTGDGPIPFSRTRPKKTVKHQRVSTRYKPLPNGRANAHAQHSNRHPKPIINLPRWHRLPLEGERFGGAAVNCTHSSSGQSMPQKLACTPNEPNTLVTISIESETPRSGEIPRVRLASMHWHADDTNGPGCQADASNSHTDGSHGKADVLRGRADAPGMSNHAETAMLGHRDDLSTHLGAGDTKHVVRKTDGFGSHADVSSGCTDTPSVKTDALIPRNAPDTVSTCPTKPKPPDIPDSAAKWTLNESDGLSGHADRSSARTGSQSVETDVETARDEAETISIHPVESKPPKSPTKGANSCANKTDGSRHHPGTLNMRMHAVTPADEVGNISMHPNEQKQPNSPAGAQHHTQKSQTASETTRAPWAHAQMATASQTT